MLSVIQNPTLYQPSQTTLTLPMHNRSRSHWSPNKQVQVVFTNNLILHKIFLNRHPILAITKDH